MPSKKNDLKTDPVIEELLQILKAKKMTEHFKKLNESISHISQLENQLETVKKQLDSVNQKLSELAKQKRPVSEAFRAMVKKLEEKIAALQSQINKIKRSIIDEARKMVAAFKQKGISALNKTVGFLKIRENLVKVSGALYSAEKGLEKVSAQLERLDEKAKKPSLLARVEQSKTELAKNPPVRTRQRNREAAI